MNAKNCRQCDTPLPQPTLSDHMLGFIQCPTCEQEHAMSVRSLATSRQALDNYHESLGTRLASMEDEIRQLQELVNEF